MNNLIKIGYLNNHDIAIISSRNLLRIKNVGLTLPIQYGGNSVKKPAPQTGQASVNQYYNRSSIGKHYSFSCISAFYKLFCFFQKNICFPKFDGSGTIINARSETANKKPTFLKAMTES